MTPSIELDADIKRIVTWHQTQLAGLPYCFILLNEIHPNENDHSRVLTKLLEYAGPNQDYPILSSFLQTQVFYNLTSEEAQNKAAKICTKSTKVLFNKENIDISIRTEDFGIIIENKINDAVDQDEQLQTYIDLFKDGQEVWAVYLTWDGTKKPQDISLTDKALERLNIDVKTADRNNSVYYPQNPDLPIRFVEINYQQDILPWLENSLLKEISFPGKDTRYLFSHLQVYIDCLKYRGKMLLEEQYNMTQELFEEIYSSQKSEHNFKSLLEFKQKLDAISSLIQQEYNKFGWLVQDVQLGAFISETFSLTPSPNDKKTWKRFYLSKPEERLNDCDVHLELGISAPGALQIRFDIECPWDKQSNRDEIVQYFRNELPFLKPVSQEAPGRIYWEDITGAFQSYKEVSLCKQDALAGLKQKTEEINQIIKVWKEYSSKKAA